MSTTAHHDLGDSRSAFQETADRHAPQKVPPVTAGSLSAKAAGQLKLVT